MGHIQGSDTEVLLQSPDLGAQFHPQLGIQIAQRLVEQEQRRCAHQGAGDGHPLLLTTGKLARLAIQQRSDTHPIGGLVHPLGDLVFRHSGVAQREADVARHGQLRVQRVVLEHHRHVAVPRRLGGDVTPVDQNAAAVGRFQARSDSQRGGLAAARRTHQDRQRTVRQLQIQTVHHGVAPESSGDATQLDDAHLVAPTDRPPTRNRWAARASTYTGRIPSSPAAACCPNCTLRSPWNSDKPTVNV